MIITLAGNNAYTLKKRLDELIAGFIKKHGELAIEKFDGEEADAQLILDAIQNLPFLAERKLVIVRNAGLNKILSEQAEQIAGSVPESTDLIFYETQTDKRTAFYKTLKKKTEFEEFEELDPRGLANWLVQEAK